MIRRPPRSTLFHCAAAGLRQGGNAGADHQILEALVAFAGESAANTANCRVGHYTAIATVGMAPVRQSEPARFLARVQAIRVLRHVYFECPARSTRTRQAKTPTRVPLRLSSLVLLSSWLLDVPPTRSRCAAIP